MLQYLIGHPELSVNVITFLLWQTLKATVAFAAGYAAVVLSRRASAVQHDFILRSVLMAAVILPILSLIGPQWDFAVGDSIGRVLKTGATTLNISVVAAPGADDGAITRWPVWVLLVWGSGVCIMLLYFLLGLVGTLRIVRGGRSVTDKNLLLMVNDLRHRYNIRRAVRLVISPHVTTPFTWGIIRPTIILPETGNHWHAREIRYVLLHELAHVRRLDALWYMLASFIAAVYWINPFVWIVRKRLIIESEKTCDDCVICAGNDGMAYAQHLLLVLRTLRTRRAIGPIGVGMARRSHMEGRLMSIMNSRQRSATPKRSMVIWVSVITLLVVFPLAGLSLSAPQQVKEKEKTASASGEKLPAPDESVPVDSGPTLIKQQVPEYPEEARKEGTQGTVWIRALVDKQGKVRKAAVGESSGNQMLDDAALKAAYLNEYSPAMQKDNPVAVWVKYKVDFKLDDKKKESTGG